MQIPGSKKHFCERFSQISIWEGVDSSSQLTNGPVVQCDECGEISRITWEKWEDIPKEKKRVRIKEKNLFY